MILDRFFSQVLVFFILGFPLLSNAGAEDVDDALFEIDAPIDSSSVPHKVPVSAAPAEIDQSFDIEPETPSAELIAEPKMKSDSGTLASEIAVQNADLSPDKPEVPNDNIKFSGLLKSIIGRSEFPTDRGMTLSTNRLRLGMDASITDRLSFSGAADQEVFLGNFLSSPVVRDAVIQKPHQFLDLNDTFINGDDSEYRISAYRLHFDYKDDSSDVILGRQRINWQQARIWNPADVFNPITPLQIEREQRLGIDALYVSHDLWSGDISGGLDLVVSPDQGFDQTYAGVRMPIRTEPGDGAWEISPLFVSIWERTLWGAEGNGQLGDLGLNFEAVRIDEDDFGEYTQCAVGVTSAFSNNLNLDVEYFYNEGARPDPTLVTRLTTTRIITTQEHFFNIRLQYTLDTRTDVEFVAVYDMEKSSSLLNPRLKFMLEENLELLAGLQHFIAGRDGGEYNNFQDLAYAWFIYSFQS